MPRLGELLVASGLLTGEQLEQALRAQIMWGARLGTNLVELGFMDLDALSSALSQQHRLPAALARHFEKVDPSLQRQLDPGLAELYACVPLMKVGRGQIVIATISPLTKKALAQIGEDLRVDPATLIPSIAAELRIRYQLERVYNIGRSSRFMRTPGKTIPPFPQFVIEEADPESDPDILLQPSDGGAPAVIVAEADVTMPFLTKEAVEAQIADEDDIVTVSRPAAELLAMLDDLEDPQTESAPPVDEAALRERRRYIRTIGDEAPAAAPEPAAPEQPQIGRIAIKRAAVAAREPDPSADGNTLGEATRAIRRAKDRDKVADLAMSALFRFASSCEGAVFLVIRGQTATAWKGFSRAGAPTPDLNVPLNQQGLIPRAIAANATTISPASELGPLDQLLLVSLGQASGELVVVPISIGGQVMCLIAMVTATDQAIMTAEAIAAATGAAFSRMIRDAAR